MMYFVWHCDCAAIFLQTKMQVSVVIQNVSQMYTSLVILVHKSLVGIPD